jgi:hypothetical protein
MKIRNGFVSNSSSSSFVVEKKYLTEEQKDLIINHYHYVKEHPEPFSFSKWLNDYDEWQITETEKVIKGYTILNNFDMDEFFRIMIDIPFKAVKFEDDYF